MNWKCPQCGADDNEKYSSRCSCGYEPNSKEFSSLEWVDPPDNTSQMASHKPTQTSKSVKYKIGETLYIAPIVALISAAVIPFIASWDPSKRTFAAIISACLFTSTASSLLTDDIGVRGVGAVKRSENPKYFWIQFFIQTAAAAAFLLIALFIKE